MTAPGPASSSGREAAERPGAGVAFSCLTSSRYVPSSAMAPHAHARPSFVLVVDGLYEESIRGRKATHGAGSLLYCPPHESHSQRFGSRGATKIVLSPTPWALDLLGGQRELRDAPFLHHPDAAAIARRLVDELAHGDAFSSLAIDGMGQELLALFGRGSRSRSGLSLRLARAAFDFLVEHAGEPLRVATVAAAIGASPLTLPRAFRAHFGLSMSAQQRRLRIARARAMLRTSDLALIDVALACGYCDQAHFSRAFKAEVGDTPARVRKRR